MQSTSWSQSPVIFIYREQSQDSRYKPIDWGASMTAQNPESSSTPKSYLVTPLVSNSCEPPLRTDLGICKLTAMHAQPFTSRQVPWQYDLYPVF